MKDDMPVQVMDTEDCNVCGAAVGEPCVGWYYKMDNSIEADGFDGNPCSNAAQRMCDAKMNVYVLEGGEYDDKSVMGVYANLVAAKIASGRRGLGWEGDAKKGSIWGGRGDDHRAITRYKVGGAR